MLYIHTVTGTFNDVWWKMHHQRKCVLLLQYTRYIVVNAAKLLLLPVSYMLLQHACKSFLNRNPPVPSVLSVSDMHVKGFAKGVDLSA